MNTAELMCCLIIIRKIVTSTPIRKKKISFRWARLPLLVSISKSVFERRMSTGSEDLSLLIYLDAMKFVLLGFFTLVETGDSGGAGGGGRVGGENRELKQRCF